MIKVFYDSKCGLCSREIKHYMRIAPKGIFIWLDVTENSQQLKEEGLDLVQVLKLLHAKDASGNFHIGVDAFILIWKQLKSWRILAKFVSLPIIHSLANFLYLLFANIRFKKHKHCQVASNKAID